MLRIKLPVAKSQCQVAETPCCNGFILLAQGHFKAAYLSGDVIVDAGTKPGSLRGYIQLLAIMDALFYEAGVLRRWHVEAESVGDGVQRFTVTVISNRDQSGLAMEHAVGRCAEHKRSDIDVVGNGIAGHGTRDASIAAR